MDKDNFRCVFGHLVNDISDTNKTLIYLYVLGGRCSDRKQLICLKIRLTFARSLGIRSIRSIKSDQVSVYLFFAPLHMEHPITRRLEGNVLANQLLRKAGLREMRLGKKFTLARLMLAR